MTQRLPAVAGGKPMKGRGQGRVSPSRKETLLQAPPSAGTLQRIALNQMPNLGPVEAQSAAELATAVAVTKTLLKPGMDPSGKLLSKFSNRIPEQSSAHLAMIDAMRSSMSLQDQKATKAYSMKLSPKKKKHHKSRTPVKMKGAGMGRMQKATSSKESPLAKWPGTRSSNDIAAADRHNFQQAVKPLSDSKADLSWRKELQKHSQELSLSNARSITRTAAFEALYSPFSASNHKADGPSKLADPASQDLAAQHFLDMVVPALANLDIPDPFVEEANDLNSGVDVAKVAAQQLLVHAKRCMKNWIGHNESNLTDDQQSATQPPAFATRLQASTQSSSGQMTLSDLTSNKSLDNEMDKSMPDPKKLQCPTPKKMLWINVMDWSAGVCTREYEDVMGIVTPVLNNILRQQSESIDSYQVAVLDSYQYRSYAASYHHGKQCLSLPAHHTVCTVLLLSHIAPVNQSGEQHLHESQDDAREPMRSVGVQSNDAENSNYITDLLDGNTVSGCRHIIVPVARKTSWIGEYEKRGFNMSKVWGSVQARAQGADAVQRAIQAHLKSNSAQSSSGFDIGIDSKPHVCSPIVWSPTVDDQGQLINFEFLQILVVAKIVSFLTHLYDESAAQTKTLDEPFLNKTFPKQMSSDFRLSKDCADEMLLALKKKNCVLDIECEGSSSAMGITADLVNQYLNSEGCFTANCLGELNSTNSSRGLKDDIDSSKQYEWLENRFGVEIVPSLAAVNSLLRSPPSAFLKQKMASPPRPDASNSTALQLDAITSALSAYNDGVVRCIALILPHIEMQSDASESALDSQRSILETHVLPQLSQAGRCNAIAVIIKPALPCMLAAGNKQHCLPGYMKGEQVISVLRSGLPAPESASPEDESSLLYTAIIDELCSYFHGLLATFGDVQSMDRRQNFQPKSRSITSYEDHSSDNPGSTIEEPACVLVSLTWVGCLLSLGRLPVTGLPELHCLPVPWVHSSSEYRLVLAERVMHAGAARAGLATVAAALLPGIPLHVASKVCANVESTQAIHGLSHSKKPHAWNEHRWACYFAELCSHSVSVIRFRASGEHSFLPNVLSVDPWLTQYAIRADRLGQSVSQISSPIASLLLQMCCSGSPNTVDTSLYCAAAEFPDLQFARRNLLACAVQSRDWPLVHQIASSLWYWEAWVRQSEVSSMIYCCQFVLSEAKRMGGVLPKAAKRYLSSVELFLSDLCATVHVHWPQLKQGSTTLMTALSVDCDVHANTLHYLRESINAFQATADAILDIWCHSSSVLKECPPEATVRLITRFDPSCRQTALREQWPWSELEPFRFKAVREMNKLRVLGAVQLHLTHEVPSSADGRSSPSLVPSPVMTNATQNSWIAGGAGISTASALEQLQKSQAIDDIAGLDA